MSLLCSFEAAARHSSFTAAAAELNLTQSAVSRQIRALEDSLGSVLFLRERQTVRLTLAGEAYAREIREALKRVSMATLGFRANPQGGSLTLATLPAFGSKWLTPRLGSFCARHPEISVNLVTRLEPFDFDVELVDAAIHFGSGEWTGAELQWLMDESVLPVCSPDLLARYDISGPVSLLDLPLLHLMSRPDAWEQWFTATGVEFDQVHGMLLDQFSIAIQAAKAGLGVGLLPRYLIEDDLARGDLVSPIEVPMPSSEHYYLAWPAQRADYPPLHAFRTWLLDAMHGTGHSQPPPRVGSILARS